MKRTISLILFMALLVGLLSGCGIGEKDHSLSTENNAEELPSVPAEQEDEENADELLMSVLSGGSPMVTPGGAAEYLSEYLQAQNNAELISYALVDFDHDKRNELVLETSSDLYTYIVLHCSGSDVFAFPFGARQLGELKADGSFLGSNGAASTAYFTLRFNGGGYVSVCEASGDYVSGIFEINGNPCTEQEFDEFVAAWDDKEPAMWTGCRTDAKTILTHEDIIIWLNDYADQNGLEHVTNLNVESGNSIGEIHYSFDFCNYLNIAITEEHGELSAMMVFAAPYKLVPSFTNDINEAKLAILTISTLPFIPCEPGLCIEDGLERHLQQIFENADASDDPVFFSEYTGNGWTYSVSVSDIIITTEATRREDEKNSTSTPTSSDSLFLPPSMGSDEALRIFNSTTKPNWNGYDFEALTQIVFTDYLIQCDAYQGSNTQFLVTLSGDYCPNVVDLPEITRYGSMTFLVDITTCTVSPVEDTGIEEAFETYIALGTPWYLNPDGSINWGDENIPSATNPPSQQQEAALPYLEKVERADQSIFDGPGYDYSFVGTVEVAGIYTIVEEAWDEEGNLWGKLKSGAGWVDLTDIRSEERRSEPISANYADKALLDSGNYHHCIADTSEYMVQIAFRTNEILTDFTLHSMQFNGDDFVAEEVLFSLEELNPDKPLIADVAFPGDMSMYGIRFVDSDGTIYNYSVSISGRNGSLILAEFTP